MSSFRKQAQCNKKKERNHNNEDMRKKWQWKRHHKKLHTFVKVFRTYNIDTYLES
jgi:hypothetical protein